MKQFANLFTIIFIILLSIWSFKQQLPTYKPDESLAKNSFSTDRALQHVKEISKHPHGVGQKAHATVREYIAAQLRSYGLEVSYQEGYTIGNFGNYSKAINIVSKINGTEKGKSLLLLSHYDSGLHSSFGASDAGSGVATILESVRAFLASNTKSKNDIIILISDAEELGLNGASLFINEHPWAENIGLVLNFEARGSGGPSYMLLETNGGNKKLIEAFSQASVRYPVGNSLLYSIYKTLPNDTDLTVFREQKNIDGFNFAFIDDHFDYHTALDTYERLDRNTLAHQGSYLSSMLDFFSQQNLAELKDKEDHVFFNIPVFKFVHYPFSIIWILYGFAVILFVVLLWYGFTKSTTFTWRHLFKGFIPFLMALLINGCIGYFGWNVLLYIYPAYEDMLHGFPYNGHTYIYFFAFLSLAVLFYSYKKFNPVPPANLLVAPLLVWLLICGAVNVYLPGASFFIIPVLFMLFALAVILRQKEPNVFLMLLLSLCGLFIFVPMIGMLPIGLGLKTIVLSTILTTLSFGFLLPVFVYYRSKGFISVLLLIAAIICFVHAHLNSGFNENNPKPSSLVYILDTDIKKSYWASYDKQLIEWNEAFLRPKDSMVALDKAFYHGFNHVQDAPSKAIEASFSEITKDTVIGNDRLLTICISPKRALNRLDVRSDSNILDCSVNGIALSKSYLKKRKKKLFTHFISNNDATEINFRIPKDGKLTLHCFGTSNDLLSNPLFSIPQRPAESIPLPFFINDAIITKKTIKID